MLKFASFLFYTGAGLFYLAHQIQQSIPIKYESWLFSKFLYNHNQIQKLVKKVVKIRISYLEYPELDVGSDELYF